MDTDRESEVEIAVVKEQYAEILRCLARINVTIDKMDTRVVRLEEWRWKASGAIGIIAVLSAALLTAMAKWLLK